MFLLNYHMVHHWKNFRRTVLVRLLVQLWCLRWSRDCHHLPVWTSPLLLDNKTETKMIHNRGERTAHRGTQVLVLNVSLLFSPILMNKMQYFNKTTKKPNRWPEMTILLSFHSSPLNQTALEAFWSFDVIETPGCFLAVQAKNFWKCLVILRRLFHLLFWISFASSFWRSAAVESFPWVLFVLERFWLPATPFGCHEFTLCIV